MRVVFMGTPEFAVPSLKALLDAGYGVVGVFTQPDRPVGRGHKLAACPVKKLAVERGVPVYQFERLRNEEGLACLRSLAPDIVVTAAFGQILSQALLDVPKMGTVNVHASLLPAYRGAAPINWCILNGETRTGVTTMLTDAGVDTGAMLLRRETDIGEVETAAELSVRLSQLGAELLIETLKGYIAGEIAPIPQDERLASRQPMLKKEMGLIDWTRSAKEIALSGARPRPVAQRLHGLFGRHAENLPCPPRGGRRRSGHGAAFLGQGGPLRGLRRGRAGSSGNAGSRRQAHERPRLSGGKKDRTGNEIRRGDINGQTRRKKHCLPSESAPGPLSANAASARRRREASLSAREGGAPRAFRTWRVPAPMSPRRWIAI